MGARIFDPASAPRGATGDSSASGLANLALNARADSDVARHNHLAIPLAFGARSPGRIGPERVFVDNEIARGSALGCDSLGTRLRRRQRREADHRPGRCVPRRRSTWRG